MIVGLPESQWAAQMGRSLRRWKFRRAESHGASESNEYSGLVGPIERSRFHRYKEAQFFSTSSLMDNLPRFQRASMPSRRLSTWLYLFVRSENILPRTINATADTVDKYYI